MNGVSAQLYSFGYEGTNLPSRDSHEIDHWGFYNTNSYTSKIPQVVLTSGTCPGTFTGANREPDSLRSRANLLNRITNRTGGYTEFVYSAHDYYDPATSSTKITGGARIRVQRSCTEDGSCLSQFYFYKNFSNSNSSGTLNEQPKYYRFQSAISFPVGARTYINRVSQSMDDLFDVSGYHLGYSNVTVKNVRLNESQQWVRNGYEKYYYTSFNDHGDDPPAQVQYTLSSGSISSTTAASANAYPYTTNSPRFWERGLLDLHQVYAESGKLLRETDNVYNYTASITKSVTGFKAAWTGYDLYFTYYIAGKYLLNSRPFYQSNVYTTTYDQNTSVGDNSKYTKTATDYVYDTQYLLPIQSTTYNALNPSSKDIVKIKYPVHWPCVGPCNGGPETHALTTMIANNQISTPVETLHISEEGGVQKLVAANVRKFLEYGNPLVVKPSSDWQITSILNMTGTNPYVSPSANYSTGAFTIDSRYRLSTSYTLYDQTTGNVVQGNGRDQVVRRFKWDDDPGETNSVVEELTQNYGAPTSFKTTYTYKPLVGMTSQKDANNVTTSYEYDALNRLKIVKDNSGNILSRTKTRQSTEGNIAIIEFSGNQVVNQTVDIQDAGGAAGSGYTTLWDFGDGTTFNGTSPGAWKTYTSPGSYNVTLTKTHPDYGTASAMKKITILPLPSVSLCVDGPVQGDLANPNTGVIYGACTVGTPGAYGTVSVTASPANGCGGYTYSWSYIIRYPNGTYGTPTSFGSNSATVVSPLSSSPTDHTITCTVTDACGNVTTDDVRILLYNSNDTGGGGQQQN
jgi:YD repeat-containing protein